MILTGTPPFWHHKQLNMIRLIMRGNYSMEGPTWQTVTSETKDLIKKLLVVNPKDRLTIEQALQHEVFHAQRFTRQDGELLCIVHEDINDNTDTTEEEVKEVKSERKLAISSIVPIMSSKKRFLSKKKSSVIIKNVKFNARKMFKNAICCVRFLVRLSHVHTTPVLLSLSETRINPYNMRSYRKAIERHSFNLYSHWIKKGQGQDRAAVFQHSPKRDGKRKKSQMMKSSEIMKKWRVQKSQWICIFSGLTSNILVAEFHVPIFSVTFYKVIKLRKDHHIRKYSRIIRIKIVFASNFTHCRAYTIDHQDNIRTDLPLTNGIGILPLLATKATIFGTSRGQASGGGSQVANATNHPGVRCAIFLREPNAISAVVFDPIIASIDQIILHNVVSYQTKLVVEWFTRQIDVNSRVTARATFCR